MQTKDRAQFVRGDSLHEQSIVVSAFAGWQTRTRPESSASRCNAAREGRDGRRSVTVNSLKCAAPPQSLIDRVGGLVGAQATNLTATKQAALNVRWRQQAGRDEEGSKKRGQQGESVWV